MNSVAMVPCKYSLQEMEGLKNPLLVPISHANKLILVKYLVKIMNTKKDLSVRPVITNALPVLMLITA